MRHSTFQLALPPRFFAIKPFEEVLGKKEHSAIMNELKRVKEKEPLPAVKWIPVKKYLCF